MRGPGLGTRKLASKYTLTAVAVLRAKMTHAFGLFVMWVVAAVEKTQRLQNGLFLIVQAGI